ncbi:universal stress protein [Aromatoleum toluolicum]|uniref:Universal stress protein n=1 Tax=Aromatoleum toluolicum TaxID=90060 RepID=A0ABX1NIW2_9RHOO|nr:universal stress protein [Aromatoleum toluolicum]NMF99100.1 universal stress protein [Aromatoleum toluolicum]
MVHLDQGERSAVRMAMAVSLARLHGAQLIGVFGQRAQPHRVGVVANWPSPEYSEAAAASQRLFAQVSEGLPEASWYDVNRGSDAELLRQITDFARYADLVVLGQHDDQAKPLTPHDLAEEVVLGSGRPVLIVPYAGEFTEVGRRPLIAWNASRESAHAVSDALPLIADCAEAVVVSLDARHEHAKDGCQQLSAHLACHGGHAKTEVLVVEDVGVMDVLLSRVSDVGADLLVMGAHGPAGLPFVSAGAGTRHILRHMIVPVLMSN